MQGTTSDSIEKLKVSIDSLKDIEKQSLINGKQILEAITNNSFQVFK
jgi:hypothetical protein